MAYVGEIRMFAGNFQPNGWMFCDGQLLPIDENETLYQLIGTTYGGDGQQTFGLPDLRGRVPVHFGGGVTLAEAAGVETVTLSAQQIPNHRHDLYAVPGLPGNQASPAGAVPAMSLNVVPYLNDAPTVNMHADAITATGGSQPHDNVQPYLCINFIISLYGVYPSPT